MEKLPMLSKIDIFLESWVKSYWTGSQWLNQSGCFSLNTPRLWRPGWLWPFTDSIDIYVCGLSVNSLSIETSPSFISILLTNFF